MKAVLIPARFGEPIKDIELPDKPHLAVDELSRLVGGYLERIKVRGQQNCVIWADEDGKMRSTARNIRATFLSNVEPPDFLVGDVVMTGGRGALGKDCPFTAQEIKAMLNQGGEAA